MASFYFSSQFAPWEEQYSDVLKMSFHDLDIKLNVGFRGDVCCHLWEIDVLFCGWEENLNQYLSSQWWAVAMTISWPYKSWSFSRGYNFDWYYLWSHECHFPMWFLWFLGGFIKLALLNGLEHNDLLLFKRTT